MKINKYGITLSRLAGEDLELLRQKRNADHIQRHMEFREHITEEAQKTWFETINNNNNLYFIISYEGKKIGLINSKDIQWNPLRSEAGLFIWEQSYWNTQIPAFSTLILLEIAFFVDQAEVSYCSVLSDNPRAQHFNKQLGYELLPDQENIYNQRYQLTRERFFKKTVKIIRAAETLAGAEEKTLSISFTHKDFETGIAQLLLAQADKNTFSKIIDTDSGQTVVFKKMR